MLEASVTLELHHLLNIIFLALAGALVWRYLRYGGGWKMLRMMDEPMHHGHNHGELA